MNNWPDDDPLLARFRDWLEEARAESDEPLDGADAALQCDVDARPVGLYDIVAEFTALRQELKLETKGARSLREETDAAISALREASEQFRSIDAKEDEAARRAGEPFAKSLIELDEALDRGRGVIETARRRILEDSLDEAMSLLRELSRREPWWRRWACGRYTRTLEESWRRQVGDAHRQLFDSLLEGYGLIQNRLQRAMKKEQIQRIACVGQPVDPQCMKVVEVVDEPNRPAGLVLEEVRRGYYWRGQVLRFAEVRRRATAAMSEDVSRRLISNGR